MMEPSPITPTDQLKIEIPLSLKNIDSHLQLWIRPKYYIDVFDQGQAYESLLQLEQVLNTESYEA